MSGLAPLAVERRARLEAALAVAPFDWLMVSRPESVFYATGHTSISADLFREYVSVALLGPTGPWLVAPSSEAGPALADGVVPSERFIPYGTFFFESEGAAHPATGMAGRHASPAEAVEVALRAVGDGVIGVDGRAAARFADELRGREVVDATSWMADLRAVKLPGELALLTRAAALAEAGIDAAIEAAAPGVTERDLAAIVARTMADGGGTPRFTVVASGTRSALADVRPTARAIGVGDLVRFDVGCVVDGYWSDLGRTAVVGAPDARQARLYEAILAGEEAQIAAVRPGVTAGDLHAIAVEVVEDHGLSPYRRHHCGHAIGTEVYEQPIVAPGSATPLEEGMAFCLETPYYELGWGGMMVEDLVVVTAAGADVRSTSDRSLRVIVP